MNLPCPVETCDRPRRGTEQICGACQADLQRALAAVPDLAAELDVTLARQGTRPAGGRSSTVPLPYDPRATEAAYVLRNTLTGWVRVLLEGVTRPEGPRCASCEHWTCGLIRYATEPDDTLPDMAAWLSERHRALLSHRAADEAHGEIVAAVRAARSVIDRPAERTFAGRCECGVALYARPGAAVVQCRKCDADPYDVEQQWESMREEIRDQLAHPSGASALLARLGVKAPESTIRRWAKLGRIIAHGMDRQGRHLYRIGDILETISEDGRKRTPVRS